MLYAKLPYDPLKDDNDIIGRLAANPVVPCCLCTTLVFNLIVLSSDPRLAKIVGDEDIVYPDNNLHRVSPGALSFLRALLVKDPDQRIGCSPNGARKEVRLQACSVWCWAVTLVGCCLHLVLMMKIMPNRLCFILGSPTGLPTTKST